MKNCFKNELKKAASTFVLMLLIIATLMTCLSTANAQTNLPTYTYLSVSPDPAEINQQVTMSMWLNIINPSASASSGGRWQDFTVAITKPDGTSQTLGPFTADDASFAHALYTPDQLGTYTLEFSFPGQHVTGPSVLGLPLDAYYAASSFSTTLTVQKEPSSSTPQASLPTSYWTRPINSQNTEWYAISGNWLGTLPARADSYSENVAPYSLGPDSAHVLWTKPLMYGGLIGGEFGNTLRSNYYTGRDYQMAFTPPVVVNGVLYYNAPIAPYEGYYAVNLKTGETLWYSNATSIGTGRPQAITLGQIYNYQSPNQEGGTPYLWNTVGSTWIMYDANTGNQILEINDVKGGTTATGPNGELLVYVIGNGWIGMWNSSLCIMASTPYSLAANINEWTWRPGINASLHWSAGLQWNVSVTPCSGLSIVNINSGVVIATQLSGGLSSVTPRGSGVVVGYNSTTGQQLWANNLTLPSGPATSYAYMFGPMADGVFTTYDAYAMQWYGWNAYTGEALWGPTASDTDPWGSLPTTGVSAISNGILYGVTVAGVRAFDLTNGEELWSFKGLQSGADFPSFNYYPFMHAGMVVADGKVYVTTAVSHGDPQFRGAQLYCVNATSGALLWSTNSFTLDYLAIADGVLLAFNEYDNQIYAYGKGPSATTVTAPDSVQLLGNNILLHGTVTDISAGSDQEAVTANFPYGLPCVSEASMSQWMEYVYKQQSKPTNVTGVPVHLTAIDPNGNFQDIGYTTSNTLGNYAIEWTPPVPGVYTVTATFEGSNSYYKSEAGTSFIVSEPATAAPSVVTPTQAPEQSSTPTAPAPTSAQSVSPSPSEAPQPSTAAATSTLTYIAIGAAVIIVVAAAAVLILRRRK
ncbi:MAG: PQQ-binding-like beta-propeller repeat protein [Candidatus Bathyarchaeota archaeon]|nr:PQQ-binding-like beta-propeller repeat protein [Candidatus Bathyarchaeota archaeon]